MHDLREVPARAAPSPDTFAFARFRSHAGEDDLPTEMTLIVIETPWSEMTQTGKPVMKRPAAVSISVGAEEDDCTDVMVERSAPTSSSAYRLLRCKRPTLCVASRFGFRANSLRWSFTSW